MISAKNFHNWNQKIEANNGKVPFIDRILHPKRVYFRWKMNRAGLTTVKKTDLETLRSMVESLAGKSSEGSEFKQKFEQAQKTLAAAEKMKQLAEAVKALPGIFGKELGTTLAQKISFYSMIGEPLPVTNCGEAVLNKMFWEAMQPIYDAKKLKMHTIREEQFGAELDPSILKRNYLLNTDVVPMLLKGIAGIVLKDTGNQVSISVADTGNKLVLEFNYDGSAMDSGKIEKINAVCASFGVSFEASSHGYNQSAKLSLPY